MLRLCRARADFERSTLGVRRGIRGTSLEHYSVESDALPENERGKGITRKIYGVNVYNPDEELPYRSGDLYTTWEPYMREKHVVV